MARANFQFHGFQFYRSVSGNDFPTTITGHVADNYSADLYPGDPVTRLSDGSYQRCAANSGAISGVISKILQYRDSAGVLRTNGRLVPANTRWTAHQDRTMIEIIPARGHLFKVCGDTALASETVGLNTPGENADHIYGPTGGAADAALGLSGTFLDISTHATTATLQWRIRELLGDMGGPRVQNDPTQPWQTWVVEANLVLDIPGLPSVTGV